MLFFLFQNTLAKVLQLVTNACRISILCRYFIASFPFEVRWAEFIVLESLMASVPLFTILLLSFPLIAFISFFINTQGLIYVLRATLFNKAYTDAIYKWKVTFTHEKNFDESQEVIYCEGKILVWSFLFFLFFLKCKSLPMKNNLSVMRFFKWRLQRPPSISENNFICAGLWLTATNGVCISGRQEEVEGPLKEMIKAFRLVNDYFLGYKT